jgi:16S rRNA G1207 methylase RsmC
VTGTEHYFTAEPASPDERRARTVHLAGRDVPVETAGGVFSPDHLDGGTEVLLRHVPDPPREGDLLDLGCGWGPVALSLGLRAPHARVWAVDVNERALDLTRRNAERLELPHVTAVRPEDVPDDVRFAAIWSNPPIRVGKETLHAMLRQWLHRLLPGGEAYLVVAKNLGSDSLLRWLATELDGVATVDRVATDRGFRVLRVVRG